MKDNIRLNFERNDYYTGKLLSAKDFKTEQEYLNNKRRLLNIFTLGSGILYGLDVIKTGDTRQEESISIKPGIAIDSLGREVVVPEVDTMVLSELEGFPDDEYIGALYLCLEYDERGKVEASMLDGMEEVSNEKRYNRIVEGYKAVLKEKPPELLTGIARLGYNVIPVYEDEKILIWHKSPKFMNVAEKVECSFIVIKRQKSVRINFDYNVTAKGMKILSERVHLESSDRSEQTEFELKYCLEGGSHDGSIIINSKNVVIKMGDQILPIEQTEVLVSGEGIPFNEKVVQEYYCENIKERMEIIQKESICLAKIFITQAKSVLGMRYHIDHVEDTIFTYYIYPEYVQSWMSGGKDGMVQQEEQKEDEEYEEFEEPGKSENKLKAAEIEKTKTGIIVIAKKDVGSGTYYSDEITHGLGMGQVIVETGFEVYEDDEELKREDIDETILSGDMEVFNRSRYKAYSRFLIGIVQYPKRGTFRIGINARHADFKGEWITIRWWAYKCGE